MSEGEERVHVVGDRGSESAARETAVSVALGRAIPAAGAMRSDREAASTSEARGPARPAIGRLEGHGEDTLTLHTREAYRLFAGRAADGSPCPGAPSGQRVAAVANGLRRMSREGNPYADWLLVRFYDDLLAVRIGLEARTREYEAVMAELRNRGMSLSVLGSRRPMAVPLSFRSAYGYAIAETMLAFDGLVRVVKTLVLKDRVSAVDGHRTIRQAARPLNRLFMRMIAGERALQREELRELGRRDFLPDAGGVAVARVRLAAALLGELPEAVLTGEVKPRHATGRGAAAGYPMDRSSAPDARVMGQDGGEMLL